MYCIVAGWMVSSFDGPTCKLGINECRIEEATVRQMHVWALELNIDPEDLRAILQMSVESG